MYEQAANMDNADGIFNLALAYQNGMNVDIDEIKAIDLMKRSANLGHLNSQNYLINLGIAKDKSEFITMQELEPYSSDDEYEEEESEDEKGDETFQRIEIDERVDKPNPNPRNERLVRHPLSISGINFVNNQT